MPSFLPTLFGMIAVLAYAALSPLAKKVQADIPPFAFMALVLGLMAAFSYGLSRLTEPRFSPTALSLPTWVWIGTFVLVNLIGFAAELFAIKGMPTTAYQLMYLAGPFFTAFVAKLLLQEKWHDRYTVGLVFIAIGLVIALRTKA